MTRSRLVFAALVIAMTTLAANARLAAEATVDASWPQFRGPGADNHATGEAAPSKWDQQSAAWSIDLPGEGWSSPIVSGNRVFLTTATPTTDEAIRYEVHCFDLASGKPRWRRVAALAPPRSPIHRDNSHATETPATDGERVVAYFGMTGCYCYSMQGEPLWQKDLGVFPLANKWGASSSPTIAKGLVYLQIDNEQLSHVVALDMTTGDQRWRADRPEEKTNWCTPVVWRNSQRTELVTGGKTVRSYEATSGQLLWSMPIGGRSAATASPVGDTLIIGSEDRSQRGDTPGGLFAVTAGAAGELDVFDPANQPPSVAWANHQGAIGISSPLIYEGLIYAPARGAGIIKVHDSQTGEVIKQGRIRGAAKFWASPWTADGKIFMLDEKGVTFVVQPGGKLKVLHKNTLPGRYWSSPAIAGDRLLIRSQDRLWCLQRGS